MSKYNTEKFKHVTVALNTPFAKDGSVDVEAVKQFHVTSEIKV